MFTDIITDNSFQRIYKLNFSIFFINYVTYFSLPNTLLLLLKTFCFAKIISEYIQGTMKKKYDYHRNLSNIIFSNYFKIILLTWTQLTAPEVWIQLMKACFVLMFVHEAEGFFCVVPKLSLCSCICKLPQLFFYYLCCY